MKPHWFPGGLKLKGHKESAELCIRPAPIPRRLIIPLQQHIGEAPELLVEVGQRVLAGQPLARASGFISAGAHATSSGVVSAIEPHQVPHPSGLSALCVIIDTDGEDEHAAPLPPLEDYRQVSASILRQRVRECGIVGLGGAAFPSAVKLNAGPDAQIEQLILNGVECEPYITCDDRLMRERAAHIVHGLAIIKHVLKAQQCLIAIEDNKQQARAALEQALIEWGEQDVELVTVPTRYPAGGEKQLIQALTGKEVPSDGLPLHIGVVCHNVATAAAVYQAVVHGQALISRVVTITGGGVRTPQNLEARIGTPVHSLIEHCGGYTPGIERLIMGGPMMGFALRDDTVPIIKASNCILAGEQAQFASTAGAMPCIRCGACAEACPVSLLPQQLYWHAKARDFERAQDYNLFDCIECGCCATVCPSHIPLVQYYRSAKSEISAQERERDKADLARQRYELRQARIEREKFEQAEKRRQKKAALKKDSSDKQAAIDAALTRARQKKAARQAAPQACDEPNKEQD